MYLLSLSSCESNSSLHHSPLLWVQFVQTWSGSFLWFWMFQWFWPKVDSHTISAFKLLYKEFSPLKTYTYTSVWLLQIDSDLNPVVDFNSSSNSTSYPCEFGYHYLVASSVVWMVFLPFWILALFGTCWRQCCCCCCDPIVLCGTLTDLIKV